jgi:hypothetical protein
VVLQNDGLVLGTEGSGDVVAFLHGVDHAAEPLVDRVVVVEEAAVLVQHLDGSPEHRPRAAVRRVRVARGVDVRAGLVQRRVDHEARLVDLVLGRRQGVAVLVDEDQVAGGDQAEMDGVGV